MPRQKTSRVIDIYLPVKLLQLFDETWMECGFSSRSEAMREAIRLFLEKYGGRRVQRHEH